MSPRHHRWITVPSGSLLFACLALPGYRECGINKPMTHEPVLIGACLLGAAAAVCAFALARRRGERWVAIALIVAAGLAAGVLTFGCVVVDRPYAGITMALAASLSLAGGGLAWEREARGRFKAATRYLKVLVPLVVAAIAITAALSTWKPPANEVIATPSWFPVVH
jgi:hypothetical protein